MYIFPIYSPIIPRQNSCIPPIKRIQVTIVGYPGILISKNSFCIMIIIKYNTYRNDRINPRNVANLSGFVEKETIPERPYFISLYGFHFELPEALLFGV